jgi:hypothetical protein
MAAINGYESNFDSANFSVVAAVTGGSAASSCGGDDLDAAVLEMPIYFQEGKNFQHWLRRIKLWTLQRTGLTVRLDLLDGFLDHSDALSLLPACLISPLHRTSSVATLSSCLRSASDRRAFAAVFFGGDLDASTRALHDEASWSLDPFYTFPSQGSGDTLVRTAHLLGVPPTLGTSPLSPGFAVRNLGSADGPLQPSPGSPTTEASASSAPSPVDTALLGKLFGDVSQFDSSVRASCLLIGHTFDPYAAPPTSATLGSLLEPLPGSLLVRLAELLRVRVPDLTTTSHAGWGAARRTDMVVDIASGQGLCPAGQVGLNLLKSR